jgi:hypothetical protein
MALTAEPLLDEEAVPLAVRTADTRAGDRHQLRADARAAAEASRCPRRSAAERRIPARFSTDPTGEISTVTARRLSEKR